MRKPIAVLMNRRTSEYILLGAEPDNSEIAGDVIERHRAVLLVKGLGKRE